MKFSDCREYKIKHRTLEEAITNLNNFLFYIVNNYAIYKFRAVIHTSLLNHRNNVQLGNDRTFSQSE